MKHKQAKRHTQMYEEGCVVWLCGVVVWLLSFRTQDGKVSEMVYIQILSSSISSLILWLDCAYSSDLSNSAINPLNSGHTVVYRQSSKLMKHEPFLTQIFAMLTLISLQYTPLLISLIGKLNNCILIFNFSYDLQSTQNAKKSYGHCIFTVGLGKDRWVK